MMNMSRSGLLLLISLLPCAAQTYYSVPPIDSPELAARGPHAAGVRTVTLTNPNQPDILRFDKETGKAPLADRQLTVEVWYPATLAAGQTEHTVYESAMPARGGGAVPAGVPKSFQVPGRAVRDAAPVAGQSFPLIVVSHGYPGSRTFLTWLTENLASKGYVVAAIDHTDSVFGAMRGFPSTLLNRSTDQHFVIDELTRLSQEPTHFLKGLIDQNRVAIAGYSMGGYGALATGGAGYSKQGQAFRTVPGGYLEPLTAGDSRFESRSRAHIKAVIALAPWGAQPPFNNWDAAGLAGLKVPALFIVGDQDDVSGYENGVKRAFDGATNSDRCMLVYENARHNVGGNPAPAEARLSFPTLESFEEPVWRKDRIAAINQHFITAFLDLHVKGDATRRAYFQVSVPRSSDIKDPASLWKGFQRRWALGLQLHCAGKP